jgi:hypothetical protein
MYDPNFYFCFLFILRPFDIFHTNVYDLIKSAKEAHKNKDYKKQTDW